MPFHASAPDETARILSIATVTGFEPNDPHDHPTWFSPERGVEKRSNPKAKTLRAAPTSGTQSWLCKKKSVMFHPTRNDLKKTI